LASFGTSYAGALVLNNFPMDLTDLTLPYDHPKVRMDLAAVDVLRDRERGVPRINDIRRGLNLPAFKSFEDMNPDPETVNQLKNVYKTVEDVDCLIGMMAEMVCNQFDHIDHMKIDSSLASLTFSLVHLVGHLETQPLLYL
jgi:hypothetical protein